MKQIQPSQIISFLSKRPIHLALLPLFFACYTWKQCPHFFHWSQALLFMVCCTAGLICLSGILYITLFRKWIRASIAASAAGILFFHYTALYTYLLNSSLSDTWGRHRYLLPVLIGVWILLLVVLKQSRKRFERMNTYLNALFSLLIVFEGIQGLNTISLQTDWWKVLQTDYLSEEVHQIPNLPQDSLPDIYHIILDAHTSFESLSNYWEYEDTTLRPVLAQHGFFLATHSTSSFPGTTTSISSMFEMDSVRLPRSATTGKRISWMAAARAIIRKGKVPKMLQQAGYEMVNFSIFDLPNAPRFCNSSFILDPEQTFSLLWRRTLAGYIWWNGLRTPSFQCDQEILNHLVSFQPAHTRTPKFVYAHLNLPHTPHFFDRHGTYFPRGIQPGRTLSTSYLEYLIYGDKLLAETLAELIPNLKRPTIIIIQGDHGFGQIGDATTRRIESHSIINAFYFSDQDYSGLHDSLSNLDTYRIVLDKIMRRDSLSIPTEK